MTHGNFKAHLRNSLTDKSLVLQSGLNLREARIKPLFKAGHKMVAGLYFGDAFL